MNATLRVTLPTAGGLPLVVGYLAALGMTIAIAFPLLASEPVSLRARFIGNMAFAITDGKTTLYTDFPYQSGYAGYMTWDPSQLPAGRGDLCLITHAHPDHFERSLLARMESKVIMPPSLAATMPAGRVIPFAPEMSYRDIRVQALRTLHGRMDHYSYLVTWHGLRLYFTGDTDSTEQLLAAKNLDVAFVSPWLLAAVAAEKARIDARHVIVYHHTADQEIPAGGDAVVPKQGDTLVLDRSVPSERRSTAADSDFRVRRLEAMRRIPDGLLLVTATPYRFSSPQDRTSAFLQNPDFFYFTGIETSPGAVLAIDGVAKESLLFVPTKLPGLANSIPTAKIAPGDVSATRLGLDRVLDRKELAGFLARRQEETGLFLYARGLSDAHGFPLDIALDNPDAAWNHVLAELWSAERLRPADSMLGEMRAIKDASEIDAMRRVGAASAKALTAGMASLRPGRLQREAEAAVVSACIAAGAEGPSFWPWVMTGPASAFPAPFASLLDYRHLNRPMQSGEVARVDVGCDALHYQGDVGRTAPVSGTFDAGQRETWELLIAAYRSGLGQFRDGARRDDVFAASLAEVRRRQPALATPLGKKAAEVLLGEDGLKWWGIHGVGLEAAEGAPEILRAGMVVAFEPIFSVDGQGFYLEDMILVTKDGHEILTPGLPYAAREVERAVAPPRN
jgi:Xaa-Pro aminopeptidase/L-ascorbate metabolism protein UlaG (beta-lactamase superfamily)